MSVQITMPPRSGMERFVRDFTAGSVASFVSKTAVAPIERVKLLLQVQAVSAQMASKSQYRGFMDCFVRIQAEQGIASYWRGNMANVLRHLPTQATSFVLNDLYRQVFLRGVNKDTQFSRWVAGNLMSGGVAGVTTLTATYPLDYARTRLAADIGRAQNEREFSGLTSCLLKTLRTNGIRGLFGGYVASVQYVFLYRAGYFGLFETLRSQFLHPHNKTNSAVDKCRMTESAVYRFATTFTVAECVTLAASAVSYPFDTVRRRLMMQSSRTTTQCWRDTLVKEGVAGFYKGFAANVARSMGGALILAIYEEAQRY